MKKYKEIPDFISPDDEHLFWVKEDSTEYINWEKSKQADFSNLKKTTQKLTLTLPVDIVEKLKLKANKTNIPLQSLLKFYVIRGLQAAE
jgi:hypothetical protein